MITVAAAKTGVDFDDGRMLLVYKYMGLLLDAPKQEETRAFHPLKLLPGLYAKPKKSKMSATLVGEKCASALCVDRVWSCTYSARKLAL